MTDRHTRTDAASHTVTYWHASVTVSEPVGDDSGAWTVETFYCPHNHVSAGSADMCARAHRRRVEHTGRAPKGWTTARPTGR